MHRLAVLCFAIVIIVPYIQRPGIPEGENHLKLKRLAELFQAVRDRNVEQVRTLLESGVSANAQFQMLESSILQTSDGGGPYAYRSFRPLHALGLPPNRVPVSSNSSPAGTTVAREPCADHAIASCLIRYGADPSAVDSMGDKPFNVAITYGNDELARLLLAICECRAEGRSSGAEINLDTCVPRTPLTLGFVLCLKGSEASTMELNSALRIAVGCSDWESCYVIQRAAKHTQLDPLLTAQIPVPIP